MNWRLETSSRFEKEFKKFDRYTQRIVKGWLAKNIANPNNPRTHGQALTGALTGLWCYRIGDHRLIVKIKDGRVIILAISIGHRRDSHR